MKLRQDGLASRMLAFFEHNPEEELTIAQAAVKFDAPAATVRNALRYLRELGKIENVRVVRLPAKGRMQHPGPMR